MAIQFVRVKTIKKKKKVETAWNIQCSSRLTQDNGFQNQETWGGLAPSEPAS